MFSKVKRAGTRMDTRLEQLFLSIKVRGDAPAPEPCELKLAQFRFMRPLPEPHTRKKLLHLVPMRVQARSPVYRPCLRTGPAQGL